MNKQNPRIRSDEQPLEILKTSSYLKRLQFGAAYTLNVFMSQKTKPDEMSLSIDSNIQTFSKIGYLQIFPRFQPID